MEVELRCKSCDRFMGTAYGTTIADIRCPNSSCKAGNHIKIINGDITADVRFKFLTPPQPPKKKVVEVS